MYVFIYCTAFLVLGKAHSEKKTHKQSEWVAHQSWQVSDRLHVQSRFLQIFSSLVSVQAEKKTPTHPLSPSWSMVFNSGQRRFLASAFSLQLFPSSSHEATETDGGSERLVRAGRHAEAAPSRLAWPMRATIAPCATKLVGPPIVAQRQRVYHCLAGSHHRATRGPHCSKQMRLQGRHVQS